MPSDNYDPLNDTINIIITGLLPLFILFMFKYFEKEKQNKKSFINIFDDLIIFLSAIIFPSITLFHWVSCYPEDIYDEAEAD
ncbi:24927_t:CDS:2, partial [Gigaspora margarita]